MFATILGFIGAVAFAFCGAPQAIKAYKDGHSNGISGWMLFLWLLGEICTTLYVIITIFDLILLLNYAVNIIFLGIILKFKLFPRRKEREVC